MGFCIQTVIYFFQHELRIKRVAHGSLFTMRFSAKTETEDRRLPVPAVVMAPCSTLMIIPR